MTKGSYDGVWNTTYYTWDVSTHTADGGVLYVDQVGGYRYPDQLSAGSWASYYVKLSPLANASGFDVITYKDGANALLWVIKESSENRVFMFVPTTAVLTTTTDYSAYGPSPMQTLSLGSSDFFVGPLVSTDRSVTGRVDTGYSSNDWTLNPSYGSHDVGGNMGLDQLSGEANIGVLLGKPGLFGANGPDRYPYYTVGKNLSCIPGFYDTAFGSNFALIAGQTNSEITPDFTPAPNDTIIITAGVEEYEVLRAVSPGTNLSTVQWFLMVARTV